MVESLVCLSAKSDRSFARPKEKWRPPIDGRVKVNTDGAFVEGARHGSGASVIRDHRGFVRAAQARWLGTVGDALMAEAIATRDGLVLAQEMEYLHVILESDCSVLVAALKTTAIDRSSIADLWHEIRELSGSFVVSFDVS